MVRITTWNVNGIRNPFGYKPWSTNRTFNAMFDILETDIVIMQELKIQRKDLTDDMVLVPGWDCYFSLPKHKKGTSLPVTRTFCKACMLTHCRILRRRYLHPPIRMRPHSRRRRRPRRPLPAQLVHLLPPSPRIRQYRRVSHAFTSRQPPPRSGRRQSRLRGTMSGARQ
jgi:hypothetical protein